MQTISLTAGEATTTTLVARQEHGYTVKKKTKANSAESWRYSCFHQFRAAKGKYGHPRRLDMLAQTNYSMSFRRGVEAGTECVLRIEF